MDRLAILLVKSKCFFGTKRHECAKRFYSMERALQIPPEKEEIVSELFRELVDVHQELFNAEDEVRLAAGNMPVKEPGSTKGWFDAAIEDDIVRLNLMKHSQASHSISQLNTDRHKLIAKIDAAIGEVSEPKQYATPGPGGSKVRSSS
jgi:predicted ATP-binding protein involved in virulence